MIIKEISYNKIRSFEMMYGMKATTLFTIFLDLVFLMLTCASPLTSLYTKGLLLLGNLASTFIMSTKQKKLASCKRLPQPSENKFRKDFVSIIT
ncbi:hypothetical protein NC653_023044 [Populus alba x Populus x berolinensis]|uniref:Uncharacterized protein n=1 Tax=Populus alba x Populus x berolinensis TaxID=444605 RepID=A0AAD6MGJ4_9ROSI|nr:hypothetical protein NC653_023044 [Populus alba x Populus x berolinensis]